MKNEGIIKRALSRKGVVVLAVGAVTGDYYVAKNGVVGYKGRDLNRAERIFALAAPKSDWLHLRGERKGSNGYLEV